MSLNRRLKKSRLKLGFTFIGFVTVLLVFGRLWRQANQSLWRDNFAFSWIEQAGEALKVHTLIPEYGREITWILPGELLVETAFGAGQYQWRKVFGLGELDGRGGEGLVRTSQAVLGLAIKGWRADGRTNMSWLDRVKWGYYSSFKVRQRLTLDLNQKPDWPNSSLINEYIFSQKIAAESLSLSLVNDNDLARVLANHGVEVVSVGSAFPVADKTVIRLKENRLKDSLTVAWLKSLFPLAEVRMSEQEDQWSDLVLSVGKDYN